MTDPVQLLQELIRFDTTHPPGNEEPAVAHIEGLLGAAAIESARHGRQSCRPNLVARLRGEGALLLLYGHLMPLVHGADERVPADAVPFGAEAVYRAVEPYPP